MTKEQLEYIATVLSVAQRAAIIAGIAIGAVFFFARLEHTPSVGFEGRLLGVEACELVFQVGVVNKGRMPFTLQAMTVALVVDETRRFPTEDVPVSTAAAGEGPFVVMRIPVEAAFSERIAELQLSAQLKEDPRHWRITNTAVKLPEISSDC
ncbi:MAG: hypothetical protein AAFZ02_07090 [Pseudomonadota bacterium]